MFGGMPSLQSSDQLASTSGVNSALGDTRAGAGLRGSFVNNFVGGKGNRLSSQLDAGESGDGLPWGQFALAGAALVVGLAWLKRNG